MSLKGIPTGGQIQKKLNSGINNLVSVILTKEGSAIAEYEADASYFSITKTKLSSEIYGIEIREI